MEAPLLDHRQPQRAAEAWRHFVETPLDQILGRAEAGGDPAPAMFALFRHMLAHVPAYPRFLAEQGVDPAAIQGPADL